MSSIIDYFNANKLNYTATSSTPNGASVGPYNAFDKNGKFFCSTVSSPYWQVTFEQPVVIESYIIGALTSNSWWSTNWQIYYSLDGKSFSFLQDDSMSDLRGNTKKFPLSKIITICRSFKIVGIRASDGTDDILFNSFDCFGYVDSIKAKRKCTCNCAYYKSRLITNALLALYSSFLTT